MRAHMASMRLCCRRLNTLMGKVSKLRKIHNRVEPLPERRVEIPWSQGRKHTQHSAGQLFHPHSQITYICNL